MRRESREGHEGARRGTWAVCRDVVMERRQLGILLICNFVIWIVASGLLTLLPVKRQLEIRIASPDNHTIARFVASSKILPLNDRLQRMRQLFFREALLVQPLIVKGQNRRRTPFSHAALHGS